MGCVENVMAIHAWERTNYYFFFNFQRVLLAKRVQSSEVYRLREPHSQTFDILVASSLGQ